VEAMILLRTGLVVVSSLLLAAGPPAVAWASPDSGVQNVALAEGTSPDGIVVSAPGASHVAVHEITIAPGGSTGWHYHDGQLLAVVKSGVLTRTMHDCSTEVTSAGASFVEPAGGDHVHNGLNLGADPVVLLVTYVLPAGQPLAQDASGPACDL
jgi:quercetin dioxygenase-like cupin family protein